MVQAPARRLDPDTPRTRRRNTRTSSIRISIAPTASRCGRRCATSCCSGSSRACSIFRVDNPHTKPFPFWEWLIREVQARDPDVIFLSEAFTRPKIMKALAKLGFTQSYTYFTWRTHKAELQEYLSEITALSGARILPAEFLRQHAGHPAGAPAERRAVDVQVARRAGGDAVVELRHLQRLRAARARADPGHARNISIRRNTRSRCATGTSPATSRTTSAGSTGCGARTPALLQTADLRFAQVDDAEVIGFVKESVGARQRGRRRDRARRRRAARSSGSTSATSPIGPRRQPRPVRAIENLVTGERHIVEWGGVRLTHRSRHAIRRCCFVASLARSRAVNIVPQIDVAAEGPATSSGTRTPSSISFTSRRSPTATTTASAISPA